MMDDQPKVAAPVRQEWMSDQEWAEFQEFDRWVADLYDVGYAPPIAPGQLPLLEESEVGR